MEVLCFLCVREQWMDRLRLRFGCNGFEFGLLVAMALMMGLDMSWFDMPFMTFAS